MAFFCNPKKSVTFLMIILFLIIITSSSSSNYFQDFDITWGAGRGKILNNGDLPTLYLDNYSGSGFQSKNEYLFGKFDMQLKLVPGNSAGTVTALYLSSGGSNNQDEIDFEFLGNLSGDPYTVHTNVYVAGKGDREQQFHLWFDPTDDFHTYSVLWNPQTIVFSVDYTPIREFRNLEYKGVPFPKRQAMKVYSSIWNGDQWATRGGLIKTDWAQAPFMASYRNFSASACVISYGSSAPHPHCISTDATTTPLDPYSQHKLNWVQNNYMIYNYCTDFNRFPQGFPTECYGN